MVDASLRERYLMGPIEKNLRSAPTAGHKIREWIWTPESYGGMASSSFRILCGAKASLRLIADTPDEDLPDMVSKAVEFAATERI